MHLINANMVQKGAGTKMHKCLFGLSNDSKLQTELNLGQ
jgi:hypothetical protein